MCGIAGAIDLKGQRPFSRQRLLAMTGALSHRGPDDEHTHIEPGVALGARRLALVDVAGGRQPMANESGDVWVAQEGELYEYPELRRDLLASGHILRTRCDTEAWVHLYEDAGEDVFQQARGQFAVSLWDATARILLLGRDRAGIAPLFYAQAEGWLLWASEAKGLFASGLVEPKADRFGLDFFFNFYAVGGERTCFDGVRQVPPGCYLRILDGIIALRRYADIDFPDEGDERHDLSSEQATEELEALLRDAVRLRLVGAGKVCSYLSGGLDSTTIFALACEEQGTPMLAANVGLVGPTLVDEEADARASASAFGARLIPLRMTSSDICAALPELIMAAESPVLDASAACMLRLAQAVRAEGCKIVLSGEGTDEVLAGYPWFRGRLAEGGASPIDDALRRAFPAFEKVGRTHDRFPVPRQSGQALLSCSRSLYYTHAMWEAVGEYSAADDLGLEPDRINRWHPLNRSLYVTSKILLAGMLLSAKGDRPAHNAGIEGRFPFLDERVVDFCAGLPTRFKLNGSTDKWLLRQVARKILPMQVAQRRKIMFHANVSSLFLDGGPPWIDQLLGTRSIVAAGYFDATSVENARSYLRATRENTLRRQTYELGLAGVLATQLWHHVFLGGALADLPSLQAPRSHAAAITHA